MPYHLALIKQRRIRCQRQIHLQIKVLNHQDVQKHNPTQFKEDFGTPK